MRTSSTDPGMLPSTEGLPPLRRRLMNPARRAVLAYARVRWRIHVHHADRVPAQGPVILASNHMGFFDGPLLFLVAPRPMHGLIKREMFHDPHMARILHAMGQIPIEQVAVDPRAIKVTLAALRAGDVIGIYPEGARGDGEVRHARPGVAYLALVSGAPVVPVACLGTRRPGTSVQSMPPWGARVDVAFGEPLRFDPAPWPRTRPMLTEVAEQIRRAMADHVQRTVVETGSGLPGPAPDEALYAEGRRGPEVGEKP